MTWQVTVQQVTILWVFIFGKKIDKFFTVEFEEIFYPKIIDNNACMYWKVRTTYVCILHIGCTNWHLKASNPNLFTYVYLNTIYTVRIFWTKCFPKFYIKIIRKLLSRNAFFLMFGRKLRSEIIRP
jgi:hypothetical protein